MNAKIALIVHPDGHFEVRWMEYGTARQLSGGMDLELVLQHAATNIGHALVIPLSGPDTQV